MASKTYEIPDGYIPVLIAFPASQINDAIEAFAYQGGYNEAVDGAGDGIKANKAKQAMVASINQTIHSYKAQVALATAQASEQKVIAL